MISKRLHPIALAALFLLPFSAPFASAGLPVPPKHPLDKSEYRRLVLDNGLKVLMVSDPRFNKSAASMAVDVGSLNNPRERQGLAHFLEHMLFLGTEKYPGVDDYSSYVRENGGYNNAYTAGDLTNYLLEVNHEAFEGALDRFAQFFIAPLFTEKYAERELNAVYSEHQKNLEHDGRRTDQVQRTFFRDDHPESMFSVGSVETLGGTSRNEVLGFYKTHYSANRMYLVLLGKAPLDTLAHWAKEHFVEIENKELDRPAFEQNYLPEKETFRLIRVEPVKELRSLELLFPLPGFLKDYESKPGNLLGNLIGHEGKGSLLSLLKQEGLATALSAGDHPLTHDYGIFVIDVTLTPRGLEDFREVVRLCLSYIELLKSEDYPVYYFRESRARAKLDETYSDRGEGSGRAAALSGRMPKYPLNIVERVPFLYENEDPKAYRRMLSCLRQDNLLATLTAKGLPTTDTEAHYGAKYSYAEDDSLYESFRDLPVRPELHLPPANPYMPRQATVPDRAQKEGVKPTKIIDEAGLTLYQSLDFKFLRPKASLSYKIRLPKERMGLRFKVLLDTYTACVNESLNELAYPARLAGLGYSFANGYEGVYFSINGFDESAPLLFQNFLEHMVDLKISEQTFEALKEKNLRGLRNFYRQDAYMIVRFMNYEVLQALHYRPEDQLPVVEQLTLDDIRSFAEDLYDRGYIEALVHGNVPADRAVALTRQMQKSLGIDPISRDSTFKQTNLVQAEAESLWTVQQLEVNNSCFWRQYLIGPTTPEVRAAAMVLDTFVDRPFFTEMRTNQQLGYIVWAGAAPVRDRDNAYLYFIIQSGTHPADVVEARADSFIATFVEQFDALPDDRFETIRAASIEELKQKDKTIAETAGKFNVQAFEFDGDFDHKLKTLEALESLTKEEVAALLRSALLPESRRMRTALGFAKEHASERGRESSFSDLDAWKQTRTYK